MSKKQVAPWDLQTRKLAARAARRARIRQWVSKVAIEDAFVQRLTQVDERPLHERFKEQADRWQLETQHLSSPLQRMMHPSYQAILGMAAERKQDIIRLMLRDLKSNGRDWTLALSYLTQVNPISAKDYGRTDKLMTAWLAWGTDQKII
jgi:hypothetical protein